MKTSAEIGLGEVALAEARALHRFYNLLPKDSPTRATVNHEIDVALGELKAGRPEPTREAVVMVSLPKTCMGYKIGPGGPTATAPAAVTVAYCRNESRPGWYVQPVGGDDATLAVAYYPTWEDLEKCLVAIEP